MPQHQSIIASLLLILSACVSHSPTPEAIPSPSQQTSTQSTTQHSSNTSWQFALHDQTHSYHSTSYTIIRELTPALPRIDTLKLDTYFTIRVNQLQSPIEIAGYINRITINQNTRPDSETNTIQTRIPFSGTLTTYESTLNLSDTETNCASPMSATLGEIRPVITTYPQLLSSTSTWVDSLSITTCSSIGIPITLETHRSYQVSGEVDYLKKRVLLINRTEVAHLRGDGHQEQHQVHIVGTGMADSRIYLDVNSGTLIALETNQKIEMNIASSGQVRHFIQDITQKTELTF